ncbi:DsbA family oxidoreductase [Psychrobacter sp. P11G5]|uniref:DsbA family oxidoreductase n=1 Tax=Psychrobacter sp. P11G5 TaxID=1699624 RepID=UPI00078C4EB5|nr:DsbA family oxidoreductase [Psychrobacter sp. P11G5]AMN68063.1 disulfide bond formation protein DsbA [Psychrobacter sp. P11G5]
MENSKQLSSEQPLRIDIVSDVVCPWCVIGYRQLAEALEQTNTEHKIHWHPFELNPDMPIEGQNLREHITEKYGSSREESDASRVRMTEAGSEVGFEFNFTEETRTYNTFDLHQLLHWADQQGRMHDLKQALFAAHFTNGRNISDKGVLADIAAEIGLDRSEAVAVLKDQRFAEEVRQAQQQWRQQGIQSVPSVIFNQKHLVSGAQGVENFKSILQQLADLPE